jgi:hypothetical protein
MQTPGMSCLWRKSQSAPCSCAYQLLGPRKECFNHLFTLGEGTLVMRQQGLSLAKKTRIGLCIARAESSWNLLHDALSGLEIDANAAQELYLMTDALDRRPLLGVSLPGKPLHLSFRLDGLVWESAAVQSLIRDFTGVPLDCHHSRRLGAGAWLDEWTQAEDRCGEIQRLQELRDRLHECRKLEVRVNAGPQRVVTQFSPAFVDAAGSVIRIVDRTLRQVVHVDAGDPAFSLHLTGKDEWQLSRKEVAA